MLLSARGQHPDGIRCRFDHLLAIQRRDVMHKEQQQKEIAKNRKKTVQRDLVKLKTDKEKDDDSVLDFKETRKSIG